MMAIAPVLVAIAFLVDPRPSPSSEDIAAALVMFAAGVWIVEAIYRLCRVSD